MTFSRIQNICKHKFYNIHKDCNRGNPKELKSCNEKVCAVVKNHSKEADNG